MDYLVHLIRSKGLGQVGRRTLTVGRRYGMTPCRIVQACERLVSTLEQHQCRATFPVTAVALARHPAPIRQLQEQGIELAVHGWTHVDLAGYSIEQQYEHLSRALHIFDQHGILALGFRSPYLRHNETIYKAVEAMGFRYLSNQPILWDGANESDWPMERAQAYRQAASFYNPWLSAQYPSLPSVRGQIVEIPVSLPDDEMLVERLGANSAQIAQIWTQILRQTYAREELFTIQLHPERAAICAPALSHVLSEARRYNPPVWIACLDEIATWWKERAGVRIDVTQEGLDQYDIVIQAPAQASILVRSAEVMGESEVWGDGYRLVRSRCFRVRCSSRPVLGVSVRSNGSLVTSLRQQGYLFEVSQQRARYSVYLDRPSFTHEDEQPLLQEIAMSGAPLIRVNRWPDVARSALAITGDIDALTLWDYGLRFVRK